MNEVVLVDREDRATGTLEKLEAHRKGVLHRAISVFVFNTSGELLLQRIPVVNSIYSSVKQVSDTLLSSSGNAFRKALLVQYPREGIWTIAFQTGVPGGDVRNHLEGDYVSVYVPTTPNPTSGFFLMLKREDTIELNMSVDEALKYIVSMGVVVPAEKFSPAQTYAGD